MLATFFGSFGLFYLNASLLQYGRGYTVLRTGTAILPLALPLLVSTTRSSPPSSPAPKPRSESALWSPWSPARWSRP